MTNKEWWKNYYAELNLAFGATCILCAFYFFAPTLFTFKNSLISIDGELQKVETYYEKVTSTNKLRPKTTSTKSKLILHLKGEKQMYSLMKNIGYDRRNEQYEKIKKELNNSNTIRVWIKKNQTEKWAPEVYQIEKNDGIILYDLHDAKSELYFLFPFLLVLGIFSSGLFFRHKYPKKFKRVIGF